MAVPFAIITLLLVFVVSVLLIRTGTIALVMTGVSEEVASFQAASAFSGAGFTTGEAERAISTPQRRRIVNLLIRAGSIGIVTAIASLVLSFSRTSGSAAPRFLYLVIGTVVIVLFAQSRWFNRLLSPVLRRLLSQTTTLNVPEYAHLLELQEGYRVAEIIVTEDGWLTHESLRDLHLFAEGVVVLGIHRQDGTYVSPPDPGDIFHPGDTLIVYGQKHRVMELSKRSNDDETAREEAVEDHQQVIEGAEHVSTHRED
ncbi:MAG TPA: TrkA C-terminal domain-containing protein [Halococcus sp.]|nr:TrkA C-terminal domain-containing protein [Halococcus sp.]